MIKTGPIGPRNSDRSSGFTLIEIMVALAVVAIGLVAVSKSLTHNVDIAVQLEARTIGNWVASNRMAELRMNRVFIASGSNINHVEMAGRNWKVIDNYFGTQDPNISRVVVEVYDESFDLPVISNTGYLARYRPAKL